jgi:HNH endonuclease
VTKSRGINKSKAIWTPERDDQLRSLYPHNTGEICAEIMGARLSQIYSRAKRLGIEKSAEFIASDKSSRVTRGRQHPSMIATRFQPGQTSWNKGSHYVAGGRSAETRFKKGEMSGAAQHNYVPIGTLRISKDGYLERKTTDDPSLYPARRWQFVHRLVWEATNGPIPTGHMVVFRRGQFTNDVELLTADRLECITRAENAHRNSIWRADPEMAKLYQLKGAITRQVNRIKESQHA